MTLCDEDGDILKDEMLEVEVVPKHPHRTGDDFLNAIKDLCVSFGGGAYARDYIQNYYLEGTEATKPNDPTVQQNVHQIQHTITVANKSSGNESISPYHMKNISYDSFPPQWKQF